MIHVSDQDFGLKVEDSFHEAYMTHTSTSPNYQILASLDLGRRQVELEGFKLVQKQVELSMMLWEHVEKHPLIRKYFRFLTTQDLIPSQYRQSGIQLPLAAGWAEMDRAWSQDEFVLDPTRLHLYVAATGIDGDTFKRRYLMDRYGIQVNKTSRNTVLL
jgi:arginine decarboxylase